ncbi:NAD(P)-binding protein [Marinomonas communis]|uniref:NAD(P)-binding protein n=1 Tax=Marinomonas communis TaxID=28254 RepID=UPI001D187EA3|nr:NAD(P)-binding protein [Marinomonas communis]MCC4274510.1 NAD(P)-binding protein [Marinomonas communis]
MSSQYDVVVIGAGVAGILAAILSVKKGKSTLIVDPQTEAGGLLKTYSPNEKLHFDYGTHLLMETGIEELDNILLRDINADWERFDYLNSGHFVNGQLDTDTPVLNSHSLSQELYFQGSYELIEKTGHRAQQYTNCAQQLEQRFGSTFFKTLFQPAIEKLFHTPTSNLIPNAQLLFGLNRVKAFDPVSTRSLKEHPELSDILAFHSHTEGKSGRLSFYPKKGGIGQWIEQLINQYKQLGGKLKLGHKVEAIEVLSGKIESFIIEGQRVACKQVIWTAPLFPLLQMTGKLTTSGNPPEMLDSHLIHLLVDQAPQTSMFYFSNFDPKYDHFRTTLYTNLQGQPEDNKHRVTVEVFGKGNKLEPEYGAHILNELKRCTIFSQSTQLLGVFMQTQRNSFPIYTHSFVKQRDEHFQIAKEAFSNIQFFGKASGNLFFMNDVLLDVYQRIDFA